MLSPRSLFPSLLKVAVLVTLSAAALSAAIPRGWYISGSNPHDYQTGIDDAQFNGHRVAYLRSVVPAPTGFGTLMQDFRANRYLNTRVRLRAQLKADHVADRAALWMRVDKASGDRTTILAIDNMLERPLRGTIDWQEYQIVLDVAPDATNINLGVMLEGSGDVSIANISLESVDHDIPVTAEPILNSPKQPWLQIRRRLELPFNLEFEP
jgi:hypothetical protein